MTKNVVTTKHAPYGKIRVGTVRGGKGKRMKDRDYPIMLGMSPKNKQGVGIKSKLGSGYDVYILQDDLSVQYAWIHFSNVEALDDMIQLLQRTKELWEKENASN